MKFVVFILAVCASASLVCAQPSSAGDMYRAAGDQLPAANTPAQRSLLTHPLDGPLDEAAAADLIHRAEIPLHLFDLASTLPFVEWGFDNTDPLYAAKTVNHGQELADLIIIRARLSAAKKDFPAALEDAYRIALLSRRLSVQPSLPRQAQQSDLLDRSLSLVALLLPQLDPSLIEPFVQRLEALPLAADPTEVSRVEKDSYIWLFTTVMESPEMRLMAHRLGNNFNSAFGIMVPTASMQDLFDDPELAQSAFSMTNDVFDRMIESLRQSPGERAAAMRIIPSQYGFAHALVRNAIQLVIVSYQLDMRQSLMMEMFKSAARLYAKPERPIDLPMLRAVERAYNVSAVDGGFEIRCDMPNGAAPAIIRIGLRPAVVEPTTKPS